MSDLWWRLVRFGFRLLYNELAFTYDAVSWVVSLGAWRCWGRTSLKHLDLPPGGLILELANGTGSLQLDLVQAGYTALGYDLSPYMGRIASARLRRAGFPCRLGRGRAQALPFPSSAFAAIISTFPTDFIVAPETLREVHRVLGPGGQFIIVPNAVLTGSGATAVAVEWLYRITGQRADRTSGSGGIQSFFASYGFAADLVEEDCPRSRVQVIVARKVVRNDEGLDL